VLVETYPHPSADAPGHQPSEEHIDGLTAKPLWDVVKDNDTLFPWAAALEANSDVIRHELEAKLSADREKQQVFASDSAWQNQVMGTGWSAVRLQRLGKWNTDMCKEFPQTYELLRSLEHPLCRAGCVLRTTSTRHWSTTPQRWTELHPNIAFGPSNTRRVLDEGGRPASHVGSRKTNYAGHEL
jgi:hypothetical protein